MLRFGGLLGTGLIGPASDAARLLMAYMNDGTLDGAQILSPRSIASMSTKSRIPIEGGQQGMGWKFYQDANGQPYMGHAGGGIGFATEMRIYPERGIGIVLMGNDTTFDQHSILNLAASLDW